ncbi:helix-turn-helix transcriptional regulator [Cupriavidus sp. 2TAF22]|uniref:helix-turn-helix transcriptional regulator n=1 Tax=unclassified Cupriavidus TaxID=2640874 RepID=UPI003F93DD10
MNVVTNIEQKAGTAPAVAPKTQRLYRVREVMGQLSISKATVYRMVAAGTLRLVKIGPRSSGITAESIEALLQGSKG